MTRQLLNILIERITKEEFRKESSANTIATMAASTVKEETKAGDDVATADLKTAGKAERKLRIFDFDDTLVKTQSRIKIKKPSGEMLSLTPAQYAVYERQPGDEFDYGDFGALVEPEEIGWMTRILKRVINKRGVNAAAILTARGSKKPVEEFFDLNNIPRIPIVALGDSDPNAKAQWILYVIKKFHYDVIEFFDDSPKNIKAVENLRPLVPNTKIITKLIKHVHPKPHTRPRSTNSNES